MNVVALRGRLARPAEVRVLPSGDRLVNYEVTVDGPTGRAETVPVVWFSAPAAGATLDTDAAVVVVGRVRRRFFQAGGATQSRTEVVADVVLRSAQVKRGAAALRGAAARIEEAAESPVAGAGAARTAPPGDGAPSSRPGWVPATSERATGRPVD